MFVSSSKSLFTGRMVDSFNRPLYTETFIAATQSTGNNVPFLFTYFNDFIPTNNNNNNNNLQNCPPTEAEIIEEINNNYDNLISKAINLYINPLGTGAYNQIPIDSTTYYSIVNPLKELVDENLNSVVIEYILNGVMAAGKTREMFDNSFLLTQELADERKKYKDLQDGLTIKEVLSNSTGAFTLNASLSLTPLMLKYIELYGIPIPGIGIDTVKLYQIKDSLISNEIDPYNHPEEPKPPTPPPSPGPSGYVEPFSINGYYPLYFNKETSDNISSINESEEFIFNKISYWMPKGGQIFLGNYDEWSKFRINDNYDNLIKDWNNDIEDEIENVFIIESDNPIILSISFDILNE